MLETLPEKTRKERDATHQVRSRAPAFPYAVVTGKLPDPKSVKDHLGIEVFFRQPYPRVNATVWLFATKPDRDHFLSAYPGDPMEVR